MDKDGLDSAPGRHTSFGFLVRLFFRLDSLSDWLARLTGDYFPKDHAYQESKAGSKIDEIWGQNLGTPYSFIMICAIISQASLP
jgi:hypothetical protein